MLNYWSEKQKALLKALRDMTIRLLKLLMTPLLFRSLLRTIISHMILTNMQYLVLTNPITLPFLLAEGSLSTASSMTLLKFLNLFFPELM